MPADATRSVIIGITAGICMFLFLSIIIVSFVLEYRKRQRNYKEELTAARNRFEKQLLEAQLEIQEQILSNISEDIHDNVGQVLSLAKVQINIMNHSEQISREMLDQVKDNISKALTDLRDIAKGFSTTRIREISLPEAIQNEADRINKSGTLRVKVLLLGDARKIEPQRKLILFRIIQESLQNCIRHSGASEIDILFTFLETELKLIVSDNGQGFDPEEAIRSNKGLGLMNLQQRVTLTGGTSSIESILNRGTSIIITTPYE